MHDSVRKHYTELQDDFVSEMNVESSNMKHVGNTMFIINNREPKSEFQPPKSSTVFTNSMKEKIQQCADYAEKKPSMRKKLVESMLDLEHQLNEIRAEEGFLAQMKAQQRVRQSLQAQKDKYDRDVEKLLERTAVLDSAVRAVSLQKMLVPNWHEERNSYIIRSRLSDK